MMYLNADEESLENISNSDGVRMAGDETWQDRAGHGEGTPELGHILQIGGFILHKVSIFKNWSLTWSHSRNLDSSRSFKIYRNVEGPGYNSW